MLLRDKEYSEQMFFAPKVSTKTQIKPNIEQYNYVPMPDIGVFQTSASPKKRAKNVSKISIVPLFERLKELAQLEADWDSYGAEPVSSIALVTAFELLEAVKERFSRKVREPLPQFIAPLADGGLQLEWSGQQGDIEVEIAPDGDLGYVLIQGQGTTRKFKEKHQVSLDEVLNLLSQFLIL